MSGQGFTSLTCFSAQAGDDEESLASSPSRSPGSSTKATPSKAGSPASPSGDKAARQRLLERILREAHAKAAEESCEAIWHGRIALVGLAVLFIVRALAWWEGNIPGYSVFGMHFLTTTADLCCAICAMPLFVTGTKGHCVQVGCIGPMLTLVFAMSIVDFGALCAYLVVAAPRPLPPGDHTVVDVLEACLGVWDFALLASVAFEISLCASAWRIYKELRKAGLYPPGTNPQTSATNDVSMMELICEAEDVKMVNECQCIGGSAQAAPQQVKSSPQASSPRETQLAAGTP